MAQYTQEQFQKDVESIDNSDFVKAIEKMRADYTDKNKDEVLNRAVFDAVYFVPVFHAEDNTELVKGADDKLSFTNRPKARFVLVENPDGEKYIPAFTDQDALAAFKNEQAQGCQAFVMSFADIASVVETFPNIAGFVVNPFEHNLPFPKAFVLEIKNNIMQQLAKIEEQKKKPDITMTTNE